MDDQDKYIGRRIRALRRSRGLTQEELGGRIGRSVFTLSQIERGHSLPSLLTLIALADGLECTLDDLVRQPSNGNLRKKTREHVELDEEICAKVKGMDLKTLRAVSGAIQAIFDAQK
jgi:transcriptional regulator with XRE-family HTH domain